MLEFTVRDMTCGHCASTITKAVRTADPQASIDIDLDRHLVKVGGAGNAQAIEEAIREAGYTPEPKTAT
jgi:copper chaperone